MARKSLPRWNNLLKTITELFVPEICLSCNAGIERGSRYLCAECRTYLPVNEKHICPFCGAFLNDIREISQTKKCLFCMEEDYSFDMCRAALLYNDVVRSLIHNFKYNEMTNLALFLSEYMIKYIEKHKPFSKVDYVCPVPLHPVRERERGFNQSKMLAKIVAAHFNWEYRPDFIKRIRFTKSQTRLQGRERRENVRKAFSVDKIACLKQNNILIIDDVFTTGATVNAISEELRAKDTGKIFVMTAARAETVF